MKWGYSDGKLCVMHRKIQIKRPIQCPGRGYYWEIGRAGPFCLLQSVQFVVALILWKKALYHRWKFGRSRLCPTAVRMPKEDFPLLVTARFLERRIWANFCPSTQSYRRIQYQDHVKELSFCSREQWETHEGVSTRTYRDQELSCQMKEVALLGVKGSLIRRLHRV